MPQLFVMPFTPAIGLTGLVLPGATLTFYQTGTTTLASIKDDDGDPLPNPITADAFGRFPAIYYDDTTIYRVILKTAPGVVVADFDPIASPATDLAATSGASLIGTDLGAGTISATVQTVLRWISPGYLQGWGLGSGVDIATAAAAAYGAGVRDLLVPPGDWTVNPGPVVVPDGCTLRGVGKKSRLIATTSGGGVQFATGSDSAVSDLAIQVNVASYGAVYIIGSGTITRPRVSRVLVTMLAAAACDGMIFVASNAGSNIDYLTVEDCAIVNPYRMGIEALNQGTPGDPTRPRFTAPQFRNIVVLGPSSAATPTFAPAISIDGLITDAAVINLYTADTPGTAIEVIEAINARIIDPTHARPAGALLACTGSQTVYDIYVRGMRKVSGAATVINIPSCSRAIFESCDLPETTLLNGPSPYTRLLNMRMSCSTSVCVANDGVGGGTGMQVQGGEYTSSGNTVTQAAFGIGSGATNFTASGARFAVRSDSPVFGGTGAAAAAGSSAFNFVNKGSGWVPQATSGALT